MTAVGVILGILIMLGALGAFFYFGYDFFHNQLELNIFFSIIILFVIYSVVLNTISRKTK